MATSSNVPGHNAGEIETKRTQQPDEQLIEDVDNADNEEKNLGFLAAIRLYPKAVGWSVLLSTAIIMEGYDLKLIPQMFAQPAFSQFYGEQSGDGEYTLTAAWQAGLSNGAIVGALMGLYLGGSVVDRFGFRKTMISALTAVTAIIFLQFFAQNLIMLQVSQVLIGMNSASVVHLHLTVTAALTVANHRCSHGYFPVHHDTLRRRDYTNLPQGLLDDLREPLLGMLQPKETWQSSTSSLADYAPRSSGKQFPRVSCVAL